MGVRGARAKDIYKVWNLYSRLSPPKDIFSFLVRLICCLSCWRGTRIFFRWVFNPLLFDILVAEMDKRVIGFCYLKGDFTAIRASFAVSVDSLSEGKGIGTALTKAMLEKAKTRGYRTVVLTVFYDTPGALHIYRQLGFVPMRVSMGLKVEKDA